MQPRRIFTLLFTLALIACSRNKPELIPTPGETVQPAGPLSAAAEVAGVRTELNTDAWRGIPSDLGDHFTPVLVTLTNNNDQPVRVRYSDFVLVGPSNDVYHALPPFNISETVTEPITLERTYSGFLIAPYLSRYYPRARVLRDPFLFDDVYFRRYYPAFVEIQLPTGDMIQKALPEGVLEPGGRVSGFLYFEDPDDDVGRVTYTQSVVTTGGAQLGVIASPLDTK